MTPAEVRTLASELTDIIVGILRTRNISFRQQEQEVEKKLYEELRKRLS